MGEYYGYIYKTTLPDGRYYIGQKKGTFDKNYAGSGTLITSYVSKYGKDKISIEILRYAKNKNDLDDFEKVEVADLWLTDKKCMNLKPGGNQPKDYKIRNTEKHSKMMIDRWKNAEYRQKLISSFSNKQYYNNGEKEIKLSIKDEVPLGFQKGRLDMKESQKEKISKSIKEKFENDSAYREKYDKGRDSIRGKPSWNSGKIDVYSEETKQKMSLNKKGRKWFTDGVLDTLSFVCPEGFKEGRSNICRRV